MKAKQTKQQINQIENYTLKVYNKILSVENLILALESNLEKLYIKCWRTKLSATGVNQHDVLNQCKKNKRK